MSCVIVGGGLVGSAVALELARRGVSATVLERSVPGAEASSAAAGILAPRVEAHGDASARALGLESLGLYPAWVAGLGVDVGFHRSGVLVVSERSPDPDAVRLEGAALQQHLPGVNADLGWWLEDEARLDTRRLVEAVHAAAVAAGVTFRSGAEVGALEDGRVVLSGGDSLPGTVVVCAGAWTPLVAGLESLPIRPVRGQLVALAGAPDFSSVVFGSGGYLVPRSDELVVGSTMEEVGFTRGGTAGGMLAVLGHALALLPALAERQVLRQWSSFRPGSPDGQPLVGRVGSTWVASGHFRNGILLAPLTARLLVDAILHDAPLPASWAPDRFVPG
jgi:glycine oxidase